MIAEEMHCTVNEAKGRLTPQDFMDKLEFWKTHPPLRDHINICMANIAYTVACVNRDPKTRPPKFDKFLIDYKKAIQPTQDEVVDKIQRIMGSFTKKGK